MALSTLHRITAPLTLSSVDETGVFVGAAVAWGVENDNGVVYERGSLGPWLAAGNRPALLWQHREDEPIGLVRTAVEDAVGLGVSGVLNLDVARAREAHSLLRQGALTGISMGVLATESEVRSGVRHILAGELWELSLVTFPAERTARVAHVSAVRPLSSQTRIIRARYAALKSGGPA